MKPAHSEDPQIASIQESYDTVPYLSRAYSKTHPAHLGAIGHIFNVSTAPALNCRVLELGCAGGGNLIPMAWYLPDSEFVGMDLNEAQVNKAKRIIADLKLSNISVQQANILDISPELGKFDYLICHGVFSWVPEAVQEKILSIAAGHLTEQGIAYISYNTYPGWHMREMIRHMILYHARQFDSAQQSLDQGRAFVEFLADAVGGSSNDPYGLLVKQEWENLKASEDWYLFHEFLEVVNTPTYFHQFLQRADKQGLQYLGEADFVSMFSHEFSAKTREALEDVSQDIVQKEQYLDFLRNRQFRRTLLCRKDLELTRTLDADSLAGLLVAGAARPEPGTIDLTVGKTHKFRLMDDTLVETDNPVMKAALGILKENWPRAVPFETLNQLCVQALSEALDSEISAKINFRHELGRGLLHCYSSGSVDLKAWQGDFSVRVPQRPKVNGLTLYQAQNRLPIVNQQHEEVRLDLMTRHLIPFLDGSKERSDMVRHLAGLAEEGRFTLTRFDVPVTEPDEIYRFINQSIDKILSGLAEAGLLTQ
jgi:methyltransferase-like protein